MPKKKKEDTTEVSEAVLSEDEITEAELTEPSTLPPPPVEESLDEESSDENELTIKVCGQSVTGIVRGRKLMTAEGVSYAL
jgi:hypothetical protein